MVPGDLRGPLGQQVWQVRWGDTYWILMHAGACRVQSCSAVESGARDCTSLCRATQAVELV